MERLNKAIAQAGLASRRKADELIKEGKVKVNGKVINELGFMVSQSDEIKIDDVTLTKEELVYFVLNKPTGYITTLNDEHNRRKVLDLIKDVDKKNRIYPVGRLDYDTQGCLILTNDGELTELLTSPKGYVEKEYLARVDGIVNFDELKMLEKGIKLENGYITKKAKAYIVSIDKEHNSSLVGLIITEGKNHQVRKMFLNIGHKVKKLTRIRVANITIDGIKKGDYRPLKIHEVKQLYALAKVKPPKEKNEEVVKIKRGSTDYMGITRKTK